MTKEGTIQVLPKWFNGEIYNEGAEAINPYTGCTCWLSPIELSMYDFIKGAEFLLQGGTGGNDLVDKFYEGLWWFKDNNIYAYMILLD